jgi:hypothetical protein
VPFPSGPRYARLLRYSGKKITHKTRQLTNHAPGVSTSNERARKTTGSPRRVCSFASAYTQVLIAMKTATTTRGTSAADDMLRPYVPPTGGQQSVGCRTGPAFSLNRMGGDAGGIDGSVAP